MKSAQILNNHRTEWSDDEVLELVFRDRTLQNGLLKDGLIHELSTPLLIIRGLAASLLRQIDQQGSTSSNDHLHEISREAERLIKSLEAMSFAEPLELIQSKNIFLKNLISECLVFFEKKCLHIGISLRVDVGEDISVKSEPYRLKSILLSLLNYAVESFQNKSKDEIKSITVYVHELVDRINLSISDTGVGFTLENKSRINREILYKDIESVGIKTNLDLALAQKMAKDLNISLSSISEVTRGSVFTLTFMK